MLHNEWFMRLYALDRTKERVGPRGFQTREQMNMRIEWDAEYPLLDVPSRNLNYRFAVAEWVWMMFGHSAVEPVAQFNSVMRNFSDDGVWLTGAYGPHIKGQWSRVTDKLRKDPATRQAVIEIPRPWKNPDTKDEPCTLSLQYLLRHGTLHCTATMRSSDAWLGIPYDAYTFSAILNCMAGELEARRGWVTINMGSSHLYERDIAAMARVIDSDPRENSTLYMPSLPGRPPFWLEEVLLKRDINCIPDSGRNGAWWPYAQVLLSKSSDEAREILRNAATGRPKAPATVW